MGANVHSPYSAKYLVLLPTQPAPCALLFNHEHAFLAEVHDEDSDIVEHLVRTGRPCTPPAALSLPEVTRENGVPDGEVRCYAL